MFNLTRRHYKKLMCSSSKRSRDGHSLRKQNVRRARTAVENGRFRKAINSLSSEGLAKVTPEVVGTMLAKHPQSATPPIPSDPLSA